MNTKTPSEREQRERIYYVYRAMGAFLKDLEKFVHKNKAST